jgi:hypothetical protein
MGQALEDDAKAPPAGCDGESPYSSGSVIGDKCDWQRKDGIDDTGAIPADEGILWLGEVERIGDLETEVREDELVILREEVIYEEDENGKVCVGSSRYCCTVVGSITRRELEFQSELGEACFRGLRAIFWLFGSHGVGLGLFVDG